MAPGRCGQIRATGQELDERSALIDFLHTAVQAYGPIQVTLGRRIIVLQPIDDCTIGIGNGIAVVQFQRTAQIG